MSEQAPFHIRLREKVQSGDLATITTMRALQAWLAFLAQANRDGEAYPGDDTVASYFNVGERTIRRGKAELLESGHLTDTKRRAGRNGPKIYRINLTLDRTPAVQSQAPLTGQIRGVDRTGKGSRPDRKGALTGHPLANERVKEVKEPQCTPAGGCGGDASPVTEFLENLWSAAPPKARQRSSRREVRQAWEKLQPKPQPEAVLAAMEAWKASDDWQREAGRATPGLHRWLAKGRYENPPEPATADNPSRISAPPGKYANVGRDPSGLHPCDSHPPEEVRRVLIEAGLVPDPADMIETLRGLGIRQADDLANTPGVTPDLIDRCVAEVGKADPGKLFNAIADAAVKAAEQAKSHAAWRQHTATQAAQRERERAAEQEQQRQQRAEHDRALGLIANLDDNRLAELRDRHVQTLPVFQQHPKRVPSLDDLRSGNGAIGLRFHRLAIAKLAGGDE